MAHWPFRCALHYRLMMNTRKMPTPRRQKPCLLTAADRRCLAEKCRPCMSGGTLSHYRRVFNAFKTILGHPLTEHCYRHGGIVRIPPRTFVWRSQCYFMRRPTPVPARRVREEGGIIPPNQHDGPRGCAGRSTHLRGVHHHRTGPT